VWVHSVFRAAVNLSAPDGHLLTLLSAEVGDVPCGVRLDSTEDFSGLGIAAGDAGAFGADAIVVERSDGGGALRVDCASARRLAALAPPALRGDGALWRLGVARLDALQERLATDLRVAALLLDGRPCGAMSLRLTEAACALGRAVRAGRPEATRAAATRLIGLGPGLTPAGDDFLCGFLAAAYGRCAARPAQSRRLAALVEVLRPLLTQTTAVSAAFLRSALGGRFSQPLLALAEACAAAPDGDLDGALGRLAAVGHSSGLDAATGFFYGATVWGGAAGVQRRATRSDVPLSLTLDRSVFVTVGG